MIFREKCFSCYILLADHISLIAFTSLDLGQYVYCNYIAAYYFSVCDVINVEINLIFLIKLFFYVTQKQRQKFKYSENEKKF